MDTTRNTNRPAAPVDHGFSYGACLKCAGLGTFQAFRHVEGGECFACGGAGWRLYLGRGVVSPETPEASRAARVEAIRQVLALRAACRPVAEGGDDFLGRGHARRGVAAAFGRLMKATAAAGDLDVFDRAIAAMSKIVELNPSKVAEWRSLAPVAAEAA